MESLRHQQKYAMLLHTTAERPLGAGAGELQVVSEHRGLPDYGKSHRDLDKPNEPRELIFHSSYSQHRASNRPVRFIL